MMNISVIPLKQIFSRHFTWKNKSDIYIIFKSRVETELRAYNGRLGGLHPKKKACHNHVIRGKNGTKALYNLFWLYSLVCDE